MERQYMTFRIREATYGIPVLSIREMNFMGGYTSIPLAPEHVVGLMNLRGQIVTVLDIAVTMGFSGAKRQGDSSVLVLKATSELSPFARQKGIETHDSPVGFVVDSVGEVVRCPNADIVPAHEHISGKPYLNGVFWRGEEPIGLIDVPKLLGFKGGAAASSVVD